MPVYHVKDAKTGLELDLRGDSPPTDAELAQIFDGLAASKGPPRGSDRTREDTNLVGINHDWIANKAANLPEMLRYPAAFTGSFLGSMLEGLLTPEGVATAGVGRLPTRPSALPGEGPGATVAALRAKAAEPADAVIGGLMRRFGLDPDATELAATKLRLQAARSRTRQTRIRGQIDAQTPDAPVTPARPPVERPNLPEFEPTDAKVAEPQGGRTAEAVQAVQEQQYEDLLKKHGGRDTTPPTPSTEMPTRAAARARQPSPATPASRRSRAASPTTPITSFEDLTDLEKIQGEQLLQQGKSPQEILDHLNAMREFRAKFNTMSPEEGERAAARNRTQSRKEHAKKRAQREAGGSDDD